MMTARSAKAGMTLKATPPVASNGIVSTNACVLTKELHMTKLRTRDGKNEVKWAAM
jgi:hypothetical protein